MLLSLLISSMMYSQVLVLNENKDTTVCFTINQSKFLLNQNYRFRECDTLRIICEKQNSYKDSVISYFKLKILGYEKIESNNLQKFSLKDIEIKSLNTQIKSLNKSLRTQKFLKIASIIGFGGLSGYLGFNLLVHSL